MYVNFIRNWKYYILNFPVFFEFHRFSLFIIFKSNSTKCLFFNDFGDCWLIWFWFLVFNATVSNISAISWRPVLVVEEAVNVFSLMGGGTKVDVGFPTEYIKIILVKNILIYCQHDVFEILMEIKILAISQLVLSLLSLIFTCGPIVHLVKIMLLPMKAYLSCNDSIYRPI